MLDAGTFSVTLRQSLVLDVAAGTSAENTPWRFTATQATPRDAARWRQVTRFVEDLLGEPEAAASPLLLGSAARLLAATAVTVFPNTLVPETTPADRLDAHPATLRRAVAYLEANPDLDLAVADIARAACVTPRAVQLAFRRHLSTTPMAYLRRVRLDHAHRALLAANPRDTTVGAIAARYGFADHSRFAAIYRQTYGVLPSSSLHDR
ncbi:helix-turn-helix transcriptional regulator [Cryptosporangium japonicum]